MSGRGVLANHAPRVGWSAVAARSLGALAPSPFAIGRVALGRIAPWRRRRVGLGRHGLLA